MIKFFCDRCQKEIIEKQEVVNIQYADKKVLSKDGQLMTNYVEAKKILCGECKSEVTKLFDEKEIG